MEPSPESAKIVSLPLAHFSFGHVHRACIYFSDDKNSLLFVWRYIQSFLLCLCIKFFVQIAADVYPITTVEKVLKYIAVNKTTAGSFTGENKLCIF